MRWPSPCVYLLRSGNLHKIGTTKDFDGRYRSFVTGNPDLAVVAVLGGGPRTERRLHASFADKRVTGEWFALTDEDVTSIVEQEHPAVRWAGDLRTVTYDDGTVELERADCRVRVDRCLVGRVLLGQADDVSLVDAGLLSFSGLVKYRLVGVDPDHPQACRIERVDD